MTIDTVQVPGIGEFRSVPVMTHATDDDRDVYDILIVLETTKIDAYGGDYVHRTMRYSRYEQYTHLSRRATGNRPSPPETMEVIATLAIEYDLHARTCFDFDEWVTMYHHDRPMREFPAMMQEWQRVQDLATAWRELVGGDDGMDAMYLWRKDHGFETDE